MSQTAASTLYRTARLFSNMGDKKKIVALLSGGLDSQLAVKMMQKQGFEVEAVAIKTPFCDFDCGRGCGFEIRERADDLNVKLKTVYLGDEYIEMLKHPKHGFGAGMNPCIDCRAMMFNGRYRCRICNIRRSRRSETNESAQTCTSNNRERI